MKLEVLVEKVNKHIGEYQKIWLKKRYVRWSVTESMLWEKTRTTDVKRRQQEEQEENIIKPSQMKLVGDAAEEMPLSTTEQQVELTFCD